ncbi:MAG: hypothetical protein AAF899_10160 [Pseudomonadota bacterium]
MPAAHTGFACSPTRLPFSQPDLALIPTSEAQPELAMLQDRASETDAEKQKALLRRLVEALSRENPELYYQPTSQVARLIQQHIAERGTLDADEHELMARLSHRDIEVLLSLH